MNFPIEPEKLTSEWLTQVLRQSGVITQATVQSFEIKILDGIQGALSQNMIVELTYDTVEEGAPQSIFAKFAKQDSEHRQLYKAFYEQEVRFYKTFSHRVDIPTAQSYFAEYDDETGYFALLLEDLSYGRVGDRATGCSIDEAKFIIQEIAKFHAIWWKNPELSQMSWELTNDQVLESWQSLYQNNIQPFFDNVGSSPFSDELITVVEQVGANLISIFRRFQESPYTLIHNDYHLDNFIFTTVDDTTKLLVLDWQLMSIGHGVLDVAYFLSSNISIDDRRAYEQSLLKMYHEILVENHVKDYTFEQCWKDYRFAMFDSLFRIVYSVGDGDTRLREEQYIALRDIIAPRIYAAVLDLHPEEFLT
jgi:thiamine kinase-like enzyme